MKIENLKDLKKALNKIPDKDLETLGWGWWDETEKIDLCDWSDNAEEHYIECIEKYPILKDVEALVKNIQNATIKTYEQETDDIAEMDSPISSEDKID